MVDPRKAIERWRQHRAAMTSATYEFVTFDGDYIGEVFEAFEAVLDERDRLRDLVRWISEVGLTPATETAIRMILAPQGASHG